MDTCFGSKRHMMLCDVCGYACRSNHGCDMCENMPVRINMLMMKKFNSEIDVREGWHDYVRAVQEDRKFLKLWPNLEFNQETWEKDMRDHILARRLRYYDGAEAKEREAAKVSVGVRPSARNELTLR